MILVDTCVWVDHLRAGEPHLVDLLMSLRVVTHPHVIGEIALGSLRDRQGVLDLLCELPRARVASDEEVFALVERRQLFERGIGYMGAHLIAATLLTPGAAIWTRDKRLQATVAELGLAYLPPVH